MECFVVIFAYVEALIGCMAVVVKKASDATNYAEIFFLISS